MGDHNANENEGEVLRSRDSNLRAFVSFKNSTERVVDIIWLNFSGQRQSYTELNGLQPGRRLDMHTYKGHPWIVRDKQTGDMLEFIDGEATRKVYMPEAWDGSRNYRAPIVRIKVPVYSLYERSLQVVRKLLRNKDDVDELEIPKQIKYDVGHVRDTLR